MATSRTEGSSSGNATNATTRGTKRSAGDALESDQRLAKRLDLLNIEHNRKRYIPNTACVESQREIPQAPRTESLADLKLDADLMQVEDTPNRVYVYDLDKELADLESDEETPIFLSDIEKYLSKIPKQVLRDQKELRPTKTNQLVLYNVPSSLTVPEEHDKVKRAIVEARARVKDWPATQPNKLTDYNNRSSKFQEEDRLRQFAAYEPEAMDIEDS